MSRLPSEVKIEDFSRTTQRDGGIIAAVSLPDTNPGTHVLALSKCNIRSIFRQFKMIAVIAWDGPADRTVLFDKVDFFYMVGKIDLVKQNGPICWTIPRDDRYHLKLSEYGSYVAFAECKNMGTRICIWKTDSGDDTSIPLGCAGKVLDLDLAGESAHLVAVVTEDITILSIPSGDVQRTLYHEGARYVCISRDGSFLASWTGVTEARLWSITQGTLLATFPTGYNRPVFSRTNCLYVADDDRVDSVDRGRVYDA